MLVLTLPFVAFALFNFFFSGAVCFGLGFRNLEYYDAFILMGSAIVVSAFFTFGIFIKGQSSMIACGPQEEVEENTKDGKPAPALLVTPAVEESVSEEIDC